LNHQINKKTAGGGKSICEERGKRWGTNRRWTVCAAGRSGGMTSGLNGGFKRPHGLRRKGGKTKLRDRDESLRERRAVIGPSVGDRGSSRGGRKEKSKGKKAGRHGRNMCAEERHRAL